MEEKGEKIAAAETHHLLKGGALPVGTLKTMLGMLTQNRDLAVSKLTFGLAGARPKPAEKEKAALKNKAGLVPKSVNKAVARDLSSNFRVPYTSLSGTASFPSFMTTVNTPIVHTTASALGYGADGKKSKFTYRERLGNNNRGALSLYGFAPYTLTAVGFALTALVAAPVVVPLFLFFPHIIAEKLEDFNNSDPGNMKAKAFKKLFNGFKPNGLTSVLALGESESGKSVARVNFESDYEAGLGFTALSAVTVAGALLKKRHEGVRGNGFETAVVAVGLDELRQAYGRAGVRIKTDIQSKL